MGVGNPKSLSPPAAKSDAPQEDEDVDLSPERSSAFRSTAARAGHRAMDRLDVQYACEEVRSSMAKPTARYWAKLRRSAKYINSRPRMVHRYRKTQGNGVMLVYADCKLRKRQRIEEKHIGMRHHVPLALGQVMECNPKPDRLVICRI